MTALLIAKALLLGFLIVACGALIVTYVRRCRAGVQPWENPYASTYLDMYRGGCRRYPPPATAYERPADGEPPAHHPGSVGA